MLANKDVDDEIVPVPRANVFAFKLFPETFPVEVIFETVVEASVDDPEILKLVPETFEALKFVVVALVIVALVVVRFKMLATDANKLESTFSQDIEDVDIVVVAKVEVPVKVVVPVLISVLVAVMSCAVKFGADKDPTLIAPTVSVAIVVVAKFVVPVAVKLSVTRLVVVALVMVALVAHKLVKNPVTAVSRFVYQVVDVPLVMVALAKITFEF
jgi:hypothetical protein